MTLRITQSNVLALIQDYGRYGYQNVGLTTGGPLDEHAFLWANYLLENHFNAAQIEVTYGAFSAVFTEPTVMALCGADLSATLNEKKISPWHTYMVNAGDVICFSRSILGLRCYLAVKGGFLVAPQLSSCATVVREGIGGTHKNGGALEKGDSVAYSSSQQKIHRCVPARYIPLYSSEVVLRYIPNVLCSIFNEALHHAFSQKKYEVTQTIDRMAYRLSGEPIDVPATGIISQGVSLGMIQMPKNGQPIVLMKDHQTMGGYPFIGCVVYRDIAKLAQAVPGTVISFLPVEISDVEAALILYKRFFNVSV